MLTLLGTLTESISDCMLFLVPVQVLIFKDSCTETHDEFHFLAKQKCMTYLRALGKNLVTSLHF